MAAADLLDLSLNSQLKELPKYLRRVAPLTVYSRIDAGPLGH